MWEITERWLEMYGASGELLGAYDLPSAGIYEVVVDGQGELFLIGNDDTITLARSPTESPARCSGGRSRIIVHVADTPTASPEFATISHTLFR